MQMNRKNLTHTTRLTSVSFSLFSFVQMIGTIHDTNSDAEVIGVTIIDMKRKRSRHLSD